MDTFPTAAVLFHFLPRFTSPCCSFPTTPTVARQVQESYELHLIEDLEQVRIYPWPNTWAEAPAVLMYQFSPRPGFTSMLWIKVPTGINKCGSSDFDIRFGPETIRWPTSHWAMICFHTVSGSTRAYACRTVWSYWCFNNCQRCLCYAFKVNQTVEMRAVHHLVTNWYDRCSMTSFQQAMIFQEAL